MDLSQEIIILLQYYK